MTDATVVYLVGDNRSPKTNSWLAMTNDPAEAKRLMSELPGASTTKEVVVKPRRPRRKKK